MPAASVRGGSLTSVSRCPSSRPFTYDVPCTQCPLRVCEAFRTISEDELEFIAKLKLGELRTGPATTLLHEGSPSEQLFTLLEGWAFRYKTLEDGRRQITSFVLPGDLVGIQSSMQGEMDHSVDTLTAAVLCTFPRERVWELYKRCPSLAFDVTWLAATQEMILNENLLSIGRRNAVECAAYYLLHLYLRAEDVGLVTEGKVRFPFTQEHLADALGPLPRPHQQDAQAAFRARPDAMGAWLVLHPRCRGFG
jgi:CRP/FNR family transcriptional regulator, anaerobic regulatory protein